jgi:hypothetical protein
MSKKLILCAFRPIDRLYCDPLAKNVRFAKNSFITGLHHVTKPSTPLALALAFWLATFIITFYPS